MCEMMCMSTGCLTDVSTMLPSDSNVKVEYHAVVECLRHCFFDTSRQIIVPPATAPLHDALISKYLNGPRTSSRIVGRAVQSTVATLCCFWAAGCCSSENLVPQATHRSGRQVPVRLNVIEILLNGKRFFGATLEDLSKAVETEADRRRQLAKASIAAVAVHVDSVLQTLLTPQQNTQTASLTSTMPSAVVVTDVGGNIKDVNQSAINLFGYSSANDLLGRNVRMLVPAPHAERHDGYIAKYLARQREDNLLVEGQIGVQLR